MKRILLIPTIATLLIAGPALAGNGHGHDKAKGRKGGQDVHSVAVVPVPARGGGWNGPAHHDAPPVHHDAPPVHHDNGQHRGQGRQMWARGQHLPGTYLDQRYYIRDYHQYQLAPPPPGMVWVRPYQDDRRFYLVQTATGLISRIFGG